MTFKDDDNVERIYSKIQPDKLIASILRRENLTNYRCDISPSEEYLQVSGRFLKSGTHVKPHKHIKCERYTDITQEAWIVLDGKILAIFYDMDDSIIFKSEINKGDIAVLYRGGHSLTVLDKDTVFYEFKTGPYFGIDADKEDINDKNN